MTHGTTAGVEAPGENTNAIPTVASHRRGVHDFIYQGDGGPSGSITPIDSADQFAGMKAGGPIAQAMNGSGGNVTINVYGDERRFVDITKRVLRESGIAPMRQGTRG